MAFVVVAFAVAFVSILCSMSATLFRVDTALRINLSQQFVGNGLGGNGVSHIGLYVG
jgi:hypothetical protein